MKGRTLSLVALVIMIFVIASLAVSTAFKRNSLDDSTAGENRPNEGLEANPNSVRSSLSESERKYIAETEFYAFQILYKVGPRFEKALFKDHRALQSFFSEGFVGTILPGDFFTAPDAQALSFMSKSSEQSTPVTADRDQFIDWLRQLTKHFHTQPQTKLKLTRLSPTDSDNLKGEWQGTLKLTFSGETGQPTRPGFIPEPELNELFSRQYQIGDGRPLEISIDGSFRCDRFPNDFSTENEWISEWNIQSLQVTEAEQALFLDVTELSTIDTSTLHDNWTETRENFIGVPGGIFATDYNSDGHIDLLVTDTGPARLYAGNGDFTFVDRSVESGLSQDAGIVHNVGFADLDNDGDPDLIFGTSVFENRNGFFIRRGFIEGANPVGSLTFGDYDKDGFVDVYGSLEAPAPVSGKGDARVSWIEDQSGQANLLWRNRGNFEFEDVTEFANATGGARSTFTTVWLDADNDSWPDIYVINELGSNVLLHNQRNGQFREVRIGPTNDGFAMGVDAGDVNNDGKTDIYVGNMKSQMGQRIVANVPQGAYPDEIMAQMHRWVDGNLLLSNNANSGHLSFSEQIKGVAGGGWTYATALFDMNADGWLDIYSTCGFASFSRCEPDG